MNKTVTRMYPRGIVALEAMVVIVIILAAVTVAVPVFLQVEEVNRENISYQKLIHIKKAIVGDSAKMVEKKRPSFGFFGDLGVLPNDLQELLVRNTVIPRPVYQQYPGSGMFYGWRGPYVNDDSDLLDAWGDAIGYNTINEVDPDNGRLRIRELVCTHLNPTQEVYIYEDEVINYVEGAVLTREIPHQINATENGTIAISYPNGVTVVTETFSLANGVYSTIPTNRKIPNGHRHVLWQDEPQPYLATLNGGGSGVVNFVKQPDPSTPDTFFERNFYSTDNTDPNTGSPITPVMGTWTNDNSGNYYADGGTREYRAVFGSNTWQDYRLEVDATLYQGRGYGIYYRSDGQANITGYCLQYDPGLTSGGRVTFVVRKVYNGGERAPFQRRDMSLAEFPNVYNASHHTSITVIGDRHIIKVDGNVIFDFNDTSFMTGQPGLRSWDGQHYTDFHHLLVYDIPPLPTGEIVWWSFEEGSGQTVYGSGFNIGAPEINGTLQNLGNVYRRWENDNIHGQAIYTNGNNNGYINFGDVLDFSPGNEFSISAWVKMPSINQNNEYTVISKIRQGNQKGWRLVLTQESSYNFGAQFVFQQTRNNRRLRRLNNLEIEEDRWYHIMVTYDGTGISGDIPPDALRIYVTPFTDNAAQFNPTLITRTQGLRSNSSTTHNAPMLIGASVNGSNRFEGFIDEVRIYDHALTYNEINAVFQKEKI